MRRQHGVDYSQLIHGSYRFVGLQYLVLREQDESYKKKHKFYRNASQTLNTDIIIKDTQVKNI